MRPGMLRLTLPGWTDPEAAFSALFGDSTDVVWLDSGRGATTGVSYMGAASRVLRSTDTDRPVLDALRENLRAPALPPDPHGGFALGWVGWLGYELRFSTMGLARSRHSQYPDAAFLHIDRAVAFDHATSTVSLIALGEAWDGPLGSWRDAVLDALTRARQTDPVAAPMDDSGRPETHAVWRHSDADYLAMIAKCQRAIAAGEAYQLCLTTGARVGGTHDPVERYRALRAASPTHHGGLLRVGDVALLSSSPEVFLSIGTDRTVTSLPIKGTRPRGKSPQEDARLRAELLASDKERAENLMIVDLMRNDIGRVSEIGSVEVTSLLAVESYAQVHQLVSTPRWTLLRRVFPPAR
jgi:para-aminobenzoate synthetase component 1